MRPWQGWIALGMATGFGACVLEEYQAGPGGDATGAATGTGTGAGGAGGEGGGAAGGGAGAEVANYDCNIGAPSAAADLPQPYAPGPPPQPTRWLQAANDEDLASALLEVQPGEGIALQAGVTFGPIQLFERAEGDWIMLASSAMVDLPPPGTRVGPADAPQMARIAADGAPAITVMSTVGKYWLAGLELVADPLDQSMPIVVVGNDDPMPVTNAAHDIVLDRVLLHGTAGANLYVGLDVRSARTALVDSYLSDIHVGPTGCCAKAIRFRGPGPLLVRNNHFEASGPSLEIGGPTDTVGLVPSDVVFVKNHSTRPTAWEADDAGGDIILMHSAERVLVACNVLENAPGDSAFAIRHDSDVPTASVRDVTFSHNLVRRPGYAFSLIGSDDDAFTHERLVFRQSIIEAELIDPAQPTQLGDPLWMFWIVNGPTSLEVDHLTAFPKNAVMMLGGSKKTQLRFVDSIINNGPYGITGDGLRSPEALDVYLERPVIEGNVFIGATDAPYGPLNEYPADWLSVQFSGFLDGDYTLKPDSYVKGTATDGGDPGADVAAVMKAIDGVVVR